MAKMKIGVVGAGHLGKIHLKVLKQSENWQLIGFFDENLEKALEVANELQLHLFHSYEALLTACDAIDIVTPTTTHHLLAVQAIKAGKHVFVEKPLTQDMTEAKELLKLAEEAQIKMQVGHVERFNPAFLAAQQYQLKPMFIETHRLSEFNPRGTDVSVVLDLMIHDIDITLSLVKSNVKSISASGVCVVSDTPDIANARIEFDNGCVANLTASRISLKKMRKTRLFQRDAYISIDFLKKSTEVLRLENLPPNEPIDPLALVLNLGEQKGKKRIHFEYPNIAENNAILDELEIFAKSIISNQPVAVSVEDGYRAMDIAFKIMEKMNAKGI